MTEIRQALLVIDVQNEYFTGRLPVTFPEGSLGNILKAMDHAARADIPVAVIQHTAPSKDSPTFRKGSDGVEAAPGGREEETRHPDREEPSRQLHGN